MTFLLTTQPPVSVPLNRIRGSFLTRWCINDKMLIDVRKHTQTSTMDVFAGDVFLRSRSSRVQKPRARCMIAWTPSPPQPKVALQIICASLLIDVSQLCDVYLYLHHICRGGLCWALISVEPFERHGLRGIGSWTVSNQQVIHDLVHRICARGEQESCCQQP